MNIFLVVIAFLFMAGYYYLSSPSMRPNVADTETVLRESEMSAAVSCVSAIHSLAIEAALAEYDDAAQIAIDNNPCAAKYKVATTEICIKDGKASRSCRASEKDSESLQKYIITRSAWTTPEMTGQISKIISEKYAGKTGLGIVFTVEQPSSKVDAKEGDTETKTIILPARGKPIAIDPELVAAGKISAGNLAYLTQYTGAELYAQTLRKQQQQLTCAAGEVKVFRFRTWRCETPNAPVVCVGDTVYDPDYGDCVPDQSVVPLCGGSETPVLVDGVWNCNAAVEKKECAKGRISSYDYETNEWVCISDPTVKDETNKCGEKKNYIINRGNMFSGGISISHCNDCEIMMQDPDTCENYCAPDETKLNNSSCYSNFASCNTTSGEMAFYFGFPNDAAYNNRARASVAGLSSLTIPLDANHSANRKFNCLDCAPFQVNTDSIFSPYIASCNYIGTHSAVCGANSIFVPSAKIGNKGKCENLKDNVALIPPCPAGYSRKTISAACSPNWCDGDAGNTGIYCSATRPLMVLDASGCSYCIMPRDGQVPRVENTEITVAKNAGSNGWNGNLKITWSKNYGFEIPIVPENLPGINYFGGRIIDTENIFNDGKVINLIDALHWGDKTGIPSPMPIPVPQNLMQCDMAGTRCAAIQQPLPTE